MSSTIPGYSDIVQDFDGLGEEWRKIELCTRAWALFVDGVRVGGVWHSDFCVPPVAAIRGSALLQDRSNRQAFFEMKEARQWVREGLEETRMSLRDRNGYLPDFEIEGAHLYREALDELEDHYPGSRAALDTRRMVTLMDRAEQIGSSLLLREVWRAISKDLNNNIYDLSHQTAPVVADYEFGPSEPDVTAVHAEVQACAEKLRLALRKLELLQVPFDPESTK